ncbi:MAG: hypothetical protein WC472_02785 [Candidatus Paceibacterota bacterium]
MARICHVCGKPPRKDEGGICDYEKKYFVPFSHLKCIDTYSQMIVEEAH